MSVFEKVRLLNGFLFQLVYYPMINAFFALINQKILKKRYCNEFRTAYYEVQYMQTTVFLRKFAFFRLKRVLIRKYGKFLPKNGGVENSFQFLKTLYIARMQRIRCNLFLRNFRIKICIIFSNVLLPIHTELDFEKNTLNSHLFCKSNGKHFTETESRNKRR